MRALRRILTRGAGLFRRRARERALADGLESHLALHVDDNIRLGLAPDEARRQAVLAMGGIEAMKEAKKA